MEDFQNKIKKWVSYDTQLKSLNEKAKEIRNEKNNLSDNIFNFVDDNNLSSSIIKITDGRLKFGQNKQTAPLTLGFLEKSLMELFNDEEKVAQIMNHIREKRETKIISDIKRYYDN